MARRDLDRRPVYRWLPGLQPAPAWRGWFLLTGFSRLPGLRGLPDTLPGRMEIIGVRPFRQGEAGLAVPGAGVDRGGDVTPDQAAALAVIGICFCAVPALLSVS